MPSVACGLWAAKVRADQAAKRPRPSPPGSAQSSGTSRVVPEFEPSGQKNIGDGQLPNLGMEVFDLLVVDCRCLPIAALKYARHAFKQSTLRLVKHRRVHAKPTGQLADRLFGFQRLKRNPGLEFWMTLLLFRHS